VRWFGGAVRPAAARIAPDICYGGAGFWGARGLGLSLDRVMRLALAGVAIGAALSLASCGRKGMLDPPPSAGVSQPPTPRPSLGEQSDSVLPPPPTANPRPQRNAAAPNGPGARTPQQQSFFLDFLIGK
jgi:predicted small lipoprotein YifL